MSFSRTSNILNGELLSVEPIYNLLGIDTLPLTSIINLSKLELGSWLIDGEFISWFQPKFCVILN